MRDAGEIADFDWDPGNQNKNLKKHGVTDEESEESFFDPGKRTFKDAVHSEKEDRYILIGQTKQGKILFTAFTFRKNKIRIISSRRINKREQELYEKKA